MKAMDSKLGSIRLRGGVIENSVNEDKEAEQSLRSWNNEEAEQPGAKNGTRLWGVGALNLSVYKT